MKRALTLGLMAIGMIAASLFTSAPAFAANYTSSCSGLHNWSVSDGHGDVDINATGACSITGSVNATGHIHITASGAISGGNDLGAGGDINLSATSSGDITVGNLGAGSSITVNASSGGITAQNVVSGSATDIILTATGDITTQGVNSGASAEVKTTGGTISVTTVDTNSGGSSRGNVWLQASGNIGAGAINTHGGSTAGNVDIEANTGGTSTAFNVGGGGSNGCGTITASVTSGGGTDPGLSNFVVVIVNGDSGSDGGITVSHMTDINVSASSSHAGFIVLNAQSGPISLPAGTLSADGATGQMAGNIFLLADTVSAADGAVLSANQDNSATGSYHQVVIAANTVTVTGTSGLAIHSDGNGPATDVSTTWLGPQGSVVITTGGTLDGRTFEDDFYTTDAPFTVSGTGPLTISANGKKELVAVIARPITFSTTGTLTITANGDSTEQILITNPVVDGSTTGLSFGGNVVLSSNGLTTVGGDNGGGEIEINTVDQLTLAGTATVSANGVSSGNGGGIAVVTVNGDLKVGTGTGDFSFSAKSGTSGGNGGGIDLEPGANFVVDSSALGSDLAFNAAGSTGNGGTLTVYAQTFNNSVGVITFNGDGGSTSGDGGTVSITAWWFDSMGSSVPVSLSSSGLAITADAPGSGNGGSVSIETGPSTLTVDGSAISVAAAGSTGTGGTISLSSGNQLTVTGTLSANGAGSGTGGSITLKQGTDGWGGFSNMVLDSATISASGDSGGTGAGGTITVDYEQNGGISASGTTITADAAGTANAGTINLTGPITLDAAAAITATGAATSTTNVVSITTTSITLNGGSSISITHGRVIVSATSGTNDLAISIAGGATETITAPTVRITNNNTGQATSLVRTGGGTATLSLASADARLTTLGDVTLGAGVSIQDVDQLFLQYKGAFSQSANITVTTGINFDSSSGAGGPLTLSGSITAIGTTGSEFIDIAAGTGISQTAGLIENDHGEVTFHVQGTGDVGSNLSPILVSTGALTAFSDSGSIYVNQTDSTKNAVLQGSAPGGTFSAVSAGQFDTSSGTISGANVSITGANGLTLGSVTATAGNVVGIATTGTLNVVASKTIQATGGEVDLVINSVPGSPVSGTAPSNVSASGTIFWGSNSITALTPTNTVSASSHRIVFDEHGTGASAITLSGGVTVQTN